MTAATTIVRQPALASSPQPTSNGASANRSMYEGSQTPTPAEERVTAVCGMEVRAAATGERREPIAGFDRVRIAVVSDGFRAGKVRATEAVGRCCRKSPRRPTGTQQSNHRSRLLNQTCALDARFESTLLRDPPKIFFPQRRPPPDI